MGTPIPEQCSERLRITPFTHHHLTEAYVGWMNDPEIMRYSEQRHRQHTMESNQAYFEAMQQGPSGFYAIMEQLNVPERHIGNMTIAMNPPNGIADIAIMIGAVDAQGRGYGAEAFSLVHDALLAQPDIRKVTAGTMAVNEAMIRVAKHAGMKEDGRRIGQFLLDGKAVDLVYFASFSS